MRMNDFEFETDSLFCFKIEEKLQEHFGLGDYVNTSHMDMTIKTDTTSEITVYGSEKHLSAHIKAEELSDGRYFVRLTNVDVAKVKKRI